MIQRNPLDFETRRVQSNGRSLVISLPKQFTDQLNILRGDLIRFHLQVADKRKLVIEKINIDGIDDGEKARDNG
jgi:antitoxin component of MazEF toxin-antitoxin module